MPTRFNTPRHRRQFRYRAPAAAAHARELREAAPDLHIDRAKVEPVQLTPADVER